MSDLNVNRRSFLGLSAMATGASLLSTHSALGAVPSRDAAPALTVLHLTDTHIRPEQDAPARCRKILERIFQQHPDINLVINTGDSIYAVDYSNIPRERVKEQWRIWDATVTPFFKGLPQIHAIGNHDPWWAGKAEDEMYGLSYVRQRLGIKSPYYATRQKDWEIIVLNNSSGAVDAPQWDWLDRTLSNLPANAPLLVASHLPIYSLAGTYDGGNMSDGKRIVDLMAARSSSVVALSGHIHIQSSESLWNIHFHCNGALSGAWWEPGKAGDGSYNRTPMGYANVRLWADGHSESQYFPVP